jgi:hypothetical protein
MDDIDEIRGASQAELKAVRKKKRRKKKVLKKTRK